MAEVKYLKQGVRHTYIEWNNAGVMGYKRCWLTDKADIKTATSNLQYAGDGTKNTLYYGYELSGTVETEADDDTIDSILFGTPVVGPQAGDDFVKRYIKGSYAELASNFVGVRISIDAKNAATGAVAVFRYRVLKAQFAPEAPQPFQSEAISSRLFTFTGWKATKDVVGASPTGMPSDGCYWMLDILTDPTRFDPVPGDNLTA